VSEEDKHDKPKPVTIDLGDLRDDSSGSSGAYADAMAEMERLQKRLQNPFGDLKSIMDRQESLLKNIGGLPKSLLEQERELHRTMSALHKPSGFPHDMRGTLTEPRVAKTIEIPRMPPMPRNPIFETNERLEQLEEHFTKMLQVMTNAAAIGTEIQGHANAFLAEFKVASDETDRSARKAILVGVIAVFISVLTPLGQGIYDSYTDHTEAKIDRLTDQMIKLETSNARNSEALINELRAGSSNANDKVISQLRDDAAATREMLRQINTNLSSLKPPRPAN